MTYIAPNNSSDPRQLLQNLLADDAEVAVRAYFALRPLMAEPAMAGAIATALLPYLPRTAQLELCGCLLDEACRAMPALTDVFWAMASDRIAADGSLAPFDVVSLLIKLCLRHRPAMATQIAPACLPLLAGDEYAARRFARQMLAAIALIDIKSAGEVLSTALDLIAHPDEPTRRSARRLISVIMAAYADCAALHDVLRIKHVFYQVTAYHADYGWQGILFYPERARYCADKPHGRTPVQDLLLSAYKKAGSFGINRMACGAVQATLQAAAGGSPAAQHALWHMQRVAKRHKVRRPLMENHLRQLLLGAESMETAPTIARRRRAKTSS